MWAHEHTSTQIFIKDLPHALGMGEKDVMRTLQFIPGIIPLGESNADISIRGSTADQNLILWNDIPLYRTGHFNGLNGAINPFMLDTIHVK